MGTSIAWDLICIRPASFSGVVLYYHLIHLRPRNRVIVPASSFYCPYKESNDFRICDFLDVPGVKTFTKTDEEVIVIITFFGLYPFFRSWLKQSQKVISHDCGQVKGEL